MVFAAVWTVVFTVRFCLANWPNFCARMTGDQTSNGPAHASVSVSGFARGCGLHTVLSAALNSAGAMVVDELAAPATDPALVVIAAASTKTVETASATETRRPRIRDDVMAVVPPYVTTEHRPRVGLEHDARGPAQARMRFS